MVWLACQERLKTKQRLMSMGVVDNDTCPICGTQPELVDHLFFNSEYNKQCVEALSKWLCITWGVETLKDLYRIRQMPKTELRLIGETFCNLVYTIWTVRNEVVWHQKVRIVGATLESVQTESKIRFNALPMNRSTTTWWRTPCDSNRK